jgi:hypothetical protein
MRTLAEIQRRLLQKTSVDQEAKDMMALVVICLRGICATVLETSQSWDERGYWKKAADFELEWAWAGELSDKFDLVLRQEDWDKLPELLILLAGHLSGIKINRLTRQKNLWEGCWRKLMEKS